ncbi:MAG: GNAT family N-acetyltransferase [Oscillospiraceae bacterium]|nr:GNAT family N-acetyltransferase [Oscillospiraceae bacterium]
MNLLIRQMQSEDYDRKGYVHWKSWQQTYVGLIDEHFLANQTLKKCQSISHRWPGNILVAFLNGTIVGYGCFIRHEDGSGEVSAIYLLKEVHGLGIGRKVMDALIEQLTGYSPITLWVLKGNDHAIGFYEHYGFRLNGVEKAIPLGTELQMCYRP